MRKTREPQTVRKVLARVLLAQLIKFAVIWLFGEAVLRSINRSNEKEYQQHIEDKSRVKDAAYGSSYGRMEARS